MARLRALSYLLRIVAVRRFTLRITTYAGGAAALHAAGDIEQAGDTGHPAREGSTGLDRCIWYPANRAQALPQPSAKHRNITAFAAKLMLLNSLPISTLEFARRRKR